MLGKGNKGIGEKMNKNRRILSKTVLGFVKGFVKVENA
jgi:hypothetical protein